MVLAVLFTAPTFQAAAVEKDSATPNVCFDGFVNWDFHHRQKLDAWKTTAAVIQRTLDKWHLTRSNHALVENRPPDALRQFLQELPGEDSCDINLVYLASHQSRAAEWDFIPKHVILLRSIVNQAQIRPHPRRIVIFDTCFAAAAQQRVNGALLRCEERYPNDGPHSVLYVVVDRDAAQWREKLGSLHEEYFGPGQSDPLAPVRLEVIDRATDEALQRLIEMGLVSRTTRAIRPLWPAEATETIPVPLSEVERQRVAEFRQQANRKLKMARLLGEGELGEEARSALLEGLLPLGRALAIEGRLPEPTELNEVLFPPLAQRWGPALTPLRLFVTEAATPSKPILEQLAAV